MSDENTQEVQTPGEAQVGQEPQAVSEEANVEARPVDAVVGPTVDSQPEPAVEAETPAPEATPEASIAPATETKLFYNGQEVVERLGVFDADGAEECKLADGTTAYVPKSVLGE